jgi:hypothetical protein
MTSQINPNNINAAYPVAGQPNNTQGFRDNFTAIQTNFQYAENEINDLETKAVLKAALTGTTLDNNMNDALIYAAKIQDFSATAVNITATAGSIALDYSAGHYQSISTTGNINVSVTNWPISPTFGYIKLRLVIDSAGRTVTFSGMTNLYAAGVLAGIAVPNGVQGLNDRTITFAASGTYEFAFQTNSGGVTVTMFDLTRPLRLYTNPLLLSSSEDLAAAAAASLTTTASYFSTSAAETATLAAGTNGQIKTFMMAADSGDMVITVTNAGWKASGTGTITFDAIGDGCTLQYINSKWYCIGNNGCTFA